MNLTHSAGIKKIQLKLSVQLNSMQYIPQLPSKGCLLKSLETTAFYWVRSSINVPHTWQFQHFYGANNTGAELQKCRCTLRTSTISEE